MRVFSTLVKGVLAGATVSTRLIARLHLTSGDYNVSDAQDDITWNNGSGAETYTGFGQSLSMTLPPSQTEIKTAGATLSLSGSDAANLSTFFAETYRAQPAEIALLLFDPSTGAPAEEILMASGRLDVASIDDAPQSAQDPGKLSLSTLSVTVTPHSMDLDRVGTRTGSDQDQRLHRDANDGFFKDVAMAGRSAMNWGVAGTGSPAATTIGGMLSSIRYKLFGF